jgi:hypothetical protein
MVITSLLVAVTARLIAVDGFMLSVAVSTGDLVATPTPSTVT